MSSSLFSARAKRIMDFEEGGLSEHGRGAVLPMGGASKHAPRNKDARPQAQEGKWLKHGN